MKQTTIDEIVDAALDPDVLFFYEWAGWSYDPKIETSEQGKLRCAKNLAAAERHAKANRFYYQWRQDHDIDSREFSDEKPYYPTYYCVCHHGDEVIGSLCGIDFGRGNRPQGDPYKRVVEAELALDSWSESVEEQDAACRDIATV